MGIEHLFQLGKSDLEPRHIRLHCPEGQSGAFSEGLVLRKIGGHRQNFPAGDCQGRQHGHQLRGRSAAQKQLAGRDVRAETGVQVVGNGLPGGHVSGGGGVAVEGQTGHGGQGLPDGGLHLGRRRDGGIAQAEIKDVFRTHLCRPLPSVLKKFPDHRPIGPKAVGFFVKHGQFLLLRTGACRRSGADRSRSRWACRGSQIWEYSQKDRHIPQGPAFPHPWPP